MTEEQAKLGVIVLFATTLLTLLATFVALLSQLKANYDLIYINDNLITQLETCQLNK